MVSGCDRELNAYFIVLPHWSITWHDTTPSHIILGRPVRALHCTFKWGAASTIFKTLVCPSLEPATSNSQSRHSSELPGPVYFNYTRLKNVSFISLWATVWQNQQNGLCAQRRLRSAWAPAQSDQSSLGAHWVTKDPWFLHVDSEDSDQTGWIPRLNLNHCWTHRLFVGFVMWWLIYLSSHWPSISIGSSLYFAHFWENLPTKISEFPSIYYTSPYL